MAFLRVEKTKSGTYLRIVAAYRDGSSVRHRTLHNLGKVEDYTPEQLAGMAEKLLILSGKVSDASSGGVSTLEETGRCNYGFPMLLRHLLLRFGLDVMLDRYTRYYKLSYRLFDCLLLMLCDRFQVPCSKLHSYSAQKSYIGLKEVELHHLYRSLNYFYKHKDQIQEHLFRKQRYLTDLALDVVFYDVTTFYFDSEVVQEGALRQMGFGKDGKIGHTQVLFGLLSDQAGNPVGYEVYSGNTYEGHTFIKAMEQLRRKYKLKRVVVVADSGMMSRENIERLQQHTDFEYIVGDRPKNMKSGIQDYLCNRQNYEQVAVKQPDGTIISLQYALMEHDGRLLVATYSEKRARKDAHERLKKIEKGQQLLKSPHQIQKKAKMFYLKNTDDNKHKYELDDAKIKRDARFDGILVLSTNALDLTVPQVLKQYKELYQIEHSFRTFKSFFETRPMFHWTNERIEGHLCVCYIAQCMLAYLKNTLKDNSIQSTEENIRRIFSALQVSQIRVNLHHDPLWLASNVDEQTQNILKTLKLPVLNGTVAGTRLAQILQ